MKRIFGELFDAAAAARARVSECIADMQLGGRQQERHWSVPINHAQAARADADDVAWLYGLPQSSELAVEVATDSELAA